MSVDMVLNGLDGGFGRMDKKILPWKKSLDRMRMRIYCRSLAHHNYTLQNLVRHLPNRGFVIYGYALVEKPLMPS